MKRWSAVYSTSRNADAISLYLVISIISLATALFFVAMPTTEAMLTTEEATLIPVLAP